MTSAPDALPALLPVGLGDKGGQFNQVYIDTFERIVLGGQDIRQVLDQQADALRALMIDSQRPVLAAGRPVRGPVPGRLRSSRLDCPGALTRAGHRPTVRHSRRREAARMNRTRLCPICCSLPATLLPARLLLCSRSCRSRSLAFTDRGRVHARALPDDGEQLEVLADASGNTLLLAAIVVPLQLVMALAMAHGRRQAQDRPQHHPLHLHHPARSLRPRRGHHLARDLRAVGLPQLDAGRARA